MKIDIINPEFNHLKTIIFLHSLNQSHSEIQHIVNYLKTKKRGMKIIIPYADKIDITWSNGISEKVNSWYNYYTWNDNLYKQDSINIKQFNYNSSTIKNLIDKEAELIDPQKIFVIGIFILIKRHNIPIYNKILFIDLFINVLQKLLFV